MNRGETAGFPSKKFGEMTLYVGDDGLIYHM